MKSPGFLAGPASLLLIAGCASKPQTVGYEILSRHAGSGPVTAADIYPLHEQVIEYVVTAGDDAGTTVARRRAETSLHGAAWGDLEEGRRHELWALDEGGNLVMPAVIEHRDDALTLFRPPMIIAYDRLGPGERREQEVAMRVVDAGDPRRARDGGTAVRSIEYVGDVRLRIDSEVWDARHLEIRFEADLAMATARNAARLYVVDGLGPVVEEHDDSVTLLGVRVRGGRQTLVIKRPGLFTHPAS